MFSLSGKVNSQNPCFPCAVATLTRLLRYEFEFGWSQLASGLVYSLITSQMGIIFVFFLQAFPGLGFYAVILQTMSSLFLWYFASLFMIVSLPYFVAIQRLINFGKMVCQDNFTSIYQSIYSIFLQTFNILDFTDVDGNDEFLVVIYLLHIVFVLLIGVLLINFLIALFTNYVGTVLELKHIIIPVYLLFVLGIMELRLDRFCRWVVRKRHEKYFIRDKQGRIYVSRMIVASKDTATSTPQTNKLVYSRSISTVSEEHKFFKNNLDIQRTEGRIRKFSTLNEYENTIL